MHTVRAEGSTFGVLGPKYCRCDPRNGKGEWTKAKRLEWRFGHFGQGTDRREFVSAAPGAAFLKKPMCRVGDSNLPFSFIPSPPMGERPGEGVRPKFADLS